MVGSNYFTILYYIFYDREYFSGFIQENTIFTRMKQKSIVLVGSAQWARSFYKSAGITSGKSAGS